MRITDSTSPEGRAHCVTLDGIEVAAVAADEEQGMVVILIRNPTDWYTDETNQALRETLKHWLDRGYLVGVFPARVGEDIFRPAPYSKIVVSGEVRLIPV